MFAASGSGAMESAVANLVRPGRPRSRARPASSASAGSSSATPTARRRSSYEPDWGPRLDPAEIDRLLAENPDVKVVFATLSETSTGVVHDVRAIAEVASRTTRSSPSMRSRAWAPPSCARTSGASTSSSPAPRRRSCARPASPSPASRSARWTSPAEQPGGRYYFDWARTAKAQRKDPPDARSRPPVTLLARARRRARPDRGGGPGERPRPPRAAGPRHPRRRAAPSGLELFGDPDERSTVVTAVELPEAIDGGKVPKLLRERYDITANGGQDQLKGRILRIAHTAATSARSTSSPRSPASSWCSASWATEVELGAGVGAAQQVFARRRRPAPRREHDATTAPASSSRRRSPTPASTLLRERFDVDVGVDWDDAQLAERIGDYDGILIRSATQITADLIDRADRLKVIGRAGIGVDNVDVDGRHQARHHRRQRAAVEHRRRRRAHDRADARARAQRPAGARLADRAQWERSKFGGVEVYEKTLGVLGFGRIGQLVATARAGVRHARARLRPVRGRRALPRAGRREGRDRRASSTRGPTSSRSTSPHRRDARAGSTPRRSRR